MYRKFSSRLLSIQDGQVIFISGKAVTEANRFEVELSAGSLDPRDENIAFHMSVRFAEGAIVRNNYVSYEGWGNGDREENLIAHSSGNPIKPGEDFKIAIYVDTAAFFVTINEKPYCVFPHRHSLNEIQKLGIWGDVETVYRVDHVTASQHCWVQTNSNFYTGFMPISKPGHIITATGRPKGSGDFTINLIQTETGRNLFHLRCYLNASTIVMNDHSDNWGWRAEKILKPETFPFKLNEMFKVAVALADKSILVAVDGKHIATFDHRESDPIVFKSIGRLEIKTNEKVQLELDSVDHYWVKAECKDFEHFSHACEEYDWKPKPQ